MAHCARLSTNARTLGLSVPDVGKQLRKELCRQVNAIEDTVRSLTQRAKVDCIAAEDLLGRSS